MTEQRWFEIEIEMENGSHWIPKRWNSLKEVAEAMHEFLKSSTAERAVTGIHIKRIERKGLS